MRTNLKLLLAVILLTALIIPVAARHDPDCDLKCAWKNVCEVMPFYEARGFKTPNECIGDCRHNERAYGCPPRPFEPGPCCKGKCNADTTVCKKKWICEEICPTPTPTPVPPCPEVPCPDDEICVDGKCVPPEPTPTPTPEPPCPEVPCPGDEICVDGKCVPPEPTPTPTPEPPDGDGGGGEADNSPRDGDGYVLWDNIISYRGKLQGFYFHAFNQTNLWVDIREPKGVRYTLVNTTREGGERYLDAVARREWRGQEGALVSAREGRGYLYVTESGEWTIILLGTNEIDNPDIPRVLAANKMWISPVAENKTRGMINGIRFREVTRTLNYFQEGIPKP